MDEVRDGESALWERSLQGDARAFAALFDSHRDAVYRQAVRIAGRRDEAEEATAIAFLELWRLRARVRLVHGSVLPWLLVTTVNTARNTSRSARRYRALLARLPPPEQPPTPSAVDSLDDLHRSRQIRGALARLSHRDQQLAALVLIAELPVQDAAAALSMEDRTARNRVSLIRRRLQADLADLHPARTNP